MLVTPDQIWKPCIAVLRRRHIEHLGLLEQQLGLAGHIEPLKSVDVLAFEGGRTKTDVSPCVLVGVAGTSKAPERRAQAWSTAWTLAVEVWVNGVDRIDTVTKRDWYTMTVAECLLWRVPRHADAPPVTIEEDGDRETANAIQSLTLVDIELNAGLQPEDQRTKGNARLLFDVGVGDTFNTGPGRLPADDTPIPPGTPGGAPADPYDPAIQWPPVQSVTASIDIAQLTEDLT